MKESLSLPSSLNPEDGHPLRQLEGLVDSLPLQDILESPPITSEVPTMSSIGLTVLELMAQRGSVRVAGIESKDNEEDDDGSSQGVVGTKITGTKKDPDWEEIYGTD